MPEVIEIARKRVPAVRFIVADLFEWEPDVVFDTIFFGFWLSHVPQDRFETFWATLQRALAPGGRVFFVDNLWRELPEMPDEPEFWKRERRPDGVVKRSVSDGREFRIVKHYYDPDDLQARLRGLGWDIGIEHSKWFFYWGSGGRLG